jgi:hypothetical protein
MPLSIHGSELTAKSRPKSGTPRPRRGGRGQFENAGRATAIHARRKLVGVVALGASLLAIRSVHELVAARFRFGWPTLEPVEGVELGDARF